MAVTDSRKRITLAPENYSWVLDYYLEASELGGSEGSQVVKECGNKSCQSNTCLGKVSSWNRISGFSNIDFFKDIERISIPCLYPFSISKKFLDDLEVFKKTGTQVEIVILDPLAIGEMDELFSLADAIKVFDRSDFNLILLSGIEKSKIVIDDYPILRVSNIKSQLETQGIVFDVALGATFRQILIASLYEDPLFSLKVRRAPALGSHLNPDDLDKTFENAIANRGLENRIKVDGTPLTYDNLKRVIGNSPYCIIPGGDTDAMAERRALLALSISMDTPVVLESQRCPLSSYQGTCLSVEGFSDRARSISLSKAPSWARLCSGIGVSQVESIPSAVAESQKLRVLFLMRENVFTQSGGDSILLKRLVEGLQVRGIDVVVDVDGKEDITKFDLVHLFNFALRDHTEALARRCVENNVPYVVTSLYEDWPKFFNQMMGTYQCFEHYLKVGQPKGIWQKLEQEIAKVPASAYWDNTYTATHAKVVLTTGAEETKAVLRDYPSVPRVMSIALGSEVVDHFDGGKLFIDKFGIKDFVLCVGRLETRKNQLMLLKALEDTDHTIVFAANSFTYQPEYASLCKNFKRKGPTVFLEKLTPEELASAYQAAKVHALPSWYELPGLVSLEAARYGANVVASRNGTIEDYLGSDAYFCFPDKAESILNAVEAAYNAPKNEVLKDKVAKFSWDLSVDKHLELYQELLPSREKAEEIAKVTSAPVDIEAALKAADTLMNKQQYQEALDVYIDLAQVSPANGRVNRSLGVAYLQINDLDKSKEYFKKALSIEQNDIKALLGVGAVEWAKGSKDQAYEIYKQAANLDPSNQAAVLYLVNSSYELNRLEELEHVLREYLKNDSDNRNIQYCLAGCYFKQEKYSLASATVERILRVDTENADALELKELIAERTTINNLSGTTIIDLKEVSASQLDIDIDKFVVRLSKMKTDRKYQEVVDELEFVKEDSIGEYDELMILKAECLGCLGRIPEAMKLFENLKERESNLAKVFCGMGALNASMSDWSTAESLFIKSLEYDNSLEMPLCGLGMCAEFTSSLEDAWNYYLESVKRNPENIQAITGIIRIGYKLARLTEVESVLKEYLEMKPVDLYMLYALAGCLYAQGRTTEAVKELKNILLFEPENEKATELLSEIEAGTTYQTSAN